MQEKVYVYIGRFQGLHQVHAAAMQHAISASDHLIIQVGSSDLARDPRNPFTFAERKQVIEAVCEPMLQKEREHGKSKRLTVLPLHDYTYDNNKWLHEVQKNVSVNTHSSDITIVGSQKDETSFYLQMFPQWKQDFLPVAPGVGSTGIRKAFFETGTIDQSLPAPTQEFLRKFMCRKGGECYAAMKAEYHFNVDYRHKFDVLPFPPVFVTGDAIVVCAGHILLVERGALPGKGCWAMPGGYFETGMVRDESTGRFEQNGKADRDPVYTALRELREETRLKVPLPVLEGRIRGTKVFADPHRSLRGRIVTHATYIQLNDVTLPEVRGCKDETQGRGAFWVPIGDLVANRHMFFEDHLSIIDSFLGVL